jgi:hypothetical protein
MIYVHTTFHMPGSNGPSVIATKPTAKYRLHATAILLYTFYKRIASMKAASFSRIIFRHLTNK